MPQRSNNYQPHEATHLATDCGLLQLRGALLVALVFFSLPLVLLLTNGGAG